MAGIRWLLLAGGLLTAVSVFKLLGSHWASFSPAGQFSVLVLGALGLFASGDLARHRLHLPHVGSALLLLFAALIPVMSLGAVYLDLLGGGWIGAVSTFGGLGLLVAASRRVLHRVLRYEGWVYPAILAILASAPPILAHSAPSVNGTGGSSLLIFAVLALGGAMYAGCIHINRYLFHKDRVDGKDRPVSMVPFLLLGALYTASVAALSLVIDAAKPLEFLALPIGVMGAVLVATGEEYFRALEASTRRPVLEWPLRSKALLAIGFALMTVALPISFLDPTLRSVPLLAALGAAECFRWSRGKMQAALHGVALVLTAVAWNTSPALAPEFADSVASTVRSLTGLAKGGVGLRALANVPLIATWVLASTLLRRRARSTFPNCTSDARNLRSVYATMTLLATGVALLSSATAPLAAVYVGATLAVLLAVGGIVTGRTEHLLGLQAALGTVLLGAIAAANGWETYETLFESSFARTAVALSLLIVCGSSGMLRWFHRRLDTVGSTSIVCRDAFVVPHLFGAILLCGWTSFGLLELRAQAGLDLALVGVLFAAIGHRLRRTELLVLGSLVLTTGVHASLLLSLRGLGPQEVIPLLSICSLGLFILNWIVHRLLRSRTAEPAAQWRNAVWVGMLLHAFLGFCWFLAAAPIGVVTLEPLVFLVAGAAILETAIGRASTPSITLGLGFLTIYLPLQLWGLDLLDSFVLGVLVAGTSLLAVLSFLRIAIRRRRARAADLSPERAEALLPAVRIVSGIWIVVALLCVVTFVGLPAFLLAALVPAVASLWTWDTQREAGALPHQVVGLLLIPLLQLPFLVFRILEGSEAGWNGPCGWLALELHRYGFSLLPLTVALVVGWRAIASAALKHAGGGSLRVLTILCEVGVVAAYFASFAAGTVFSFSEHAVLTVAALALAWIHGSEACRSSRQLFGWTGQFWAGMAFLQAVAAEWIRFGHGWAPYGILAAAVCDYSLGRLFERKETTHVLAGPSRWVGSVLAANAGLLSIARTWECEDPTRLWFLCLPAFLASAFFLVTEYWGTRRPWAALGCSAFLTAALLASLRVLIRQDAIGPEYYCLVPGIGLVLLSILLRREAGPVWARRIFTAGATFIYATPIAGMWGNLDWQHQSALFLLALAFGALSFFVRSKALLVVSTAAMVIDLACFLVLVGRHEPLLLWVAGLALGTGLLALAGWIEYRREGLLQQMRVLGRELEEWY